MKKGISIFILVLTIAISGCNSPGEENVTYEYNAADTELSAELRAKIGDWAQEGVDCYGVVVGLDANGISQNGVPVKAKIVRIKKDKIKMKALETINIGPEEGCSKMGITYGQTWWELEGDLFQTIEEAEVFLRELGL